MTQINMLYVVEPTREEYLDSSARLRGISRTKLFRRLLDVILKDQMILSVLDDADKPSVLKEGERRRNVPKPTVFAGTTSAPARAAPVYVRKVHKTRTKSELYADLQLAVLNTGGTKLRPAAVVADDPPPVGDDQCSSPEPPLVEVIPSFLPGPVRTEA